MLHTGSPAEKRRRPARQALRKASGVISSQVRLQSKIQADLPGGELALDQLNRGISTPRPHVMVRRLVPTQAGLWLGVDSAYSRKPRNRGIQILAKPMGKTRSSNNRRVRRPRPVFILKFQFIFTGRIVTVLTLDHRHPQVLLVQGNDNSEGFQKSLGRDDILSPANRDHLPR
jgi:hypothetical protein